MSQEQIRQTVKYYKEGETKGNLTQSMLKANYSKVYSEHNCDRMRSNAEFKAALAEREAEIDQFEGIKVEQLDKDWEKVKRLCLKANDRTNYVRCLENQSKHEGYFEKDNQQQAEQRQLEEKERIEADRLARIRLMQPAG